MKQILSKTGKWLMAALAALLMAAPLTPAPAGAAGLLIADGGFGGRLEIRSHAASVTINNGIAVTRVSQVFVNKENRQVEALYTFPVPKHASVSNFSMWIGGKEMVGEVLEKKRAREIYDSYKSRRRDPGLLEQVDYKTFEMRIFPIGPGAEQRVEITYYQELDVDHDQATYVYPLATVTRPQIDAAVTGAFSIDLSIKSAVPIAAVGSPSHGDAFVVARHSDEYVQAGLETAGGSLARDVVFNYDLSRPNTGIDLITARLPGEDGYFCLTLSAGEDLAKQETGMDYVFVLDISGSMANDGKLLVSKDAVAAFIAALGEADRFELMAFNLSPETLFKRLSPATDQMREAAGQFLAAQRGRGGTVLSAAMNTAYQYGDPDRRLNVVVLSDGLTEQAERVKLIELIRSRPSNARVFCIGVGNEVNRPLLEQIARQSGGLAAFVSGGDDFERQARAFRRKLTRPVATNLKIDFGGMRVYDLEPATLPSLYHGAPARIYGRYAGAGEIQVTLSGDIQGAAMSQSAPLLFPDQDPNNPELERMWAWRRVDALLKQADAAGDRTGAIDEIVRLGEAYSIVTEYTSFLVLENDAEYQRWKIDRKNALRMERDRAAQQRLRERLEAIRDRAVTRLGPPDPEAEAKMARAADGKADPRHLASARPEPGQPQMDPSQHSRSQPSGAQQDRPAPPPAPERRQGFDFKAGGSGPVGPLFLGLAWWIRRRRQ